MELGNYSEVWKTYPEPPTLYEGISICSTYIRAVEILQNLKFGVDIHRIILVNEDYHNGETKR